MASALPFRWIAVHSVTQLDQFPGALLGHQPLRNPSKQPKRLTTEMLITLGLWVVKPWYSRLYLFFASRGSSVRFRSAPQTEPPVNRLKPQPFNKTGGCVLGYRYKRIRARLSAALIVVSTELTGISYAEGLTTVIHVVLFHPAPAVNQAPSRPQYFAELRHSHPQ